MKAAEISASRAIADWTPLAVVPRSSTTAEIDTFINEVSTTSTNMAIASSSASRGLPWPLSAGMPPVRCSSVLLLSSQVSAGGARHDPLHLCPV